VAAGDARRIRGLIADLDSKKYPVRKKAAVELEKIGDVAESALREALAGPVSPETRLRLDQLLQKLKSPSAEQLRTLRAIEVLEQTGNAEARRVLQKLAGGDAAGRVTQAAREAVKRVAKRGAK
jgi:hypothetical protein